MAFVFKAPRAYFFFFKSLNLASEKVLLGEISLIPEVRLVHRQFCDSFISASFCSNVEERIGKKKPYFPLFLKINILSKNEFYSLVINYGSQHDVLFYFSENKKTEKHKKFFSLKKLLSHRFGKLIASLGKKSVLGYS